MLEQKNRPTKIEEDEIIQIVVNDPRMAERDLNNFENRSARKESLDSYSSPSEIPQSVPGEVWDDDDNDLLKELLKQMEAKRVHKNA